MYHDAHNHLQDERLAPYLGGVIVEVERMGIGGAVVNGTIDSDWQAVARLASERAWVIPSYGVHPWRIKERAPDWLEQLGERLDAGGCVGEIGLDRWKEGYDFDDQQAVFRAQLMLAAERDLPVTIHCLRAWGALWDIIREEPVPARGFLLHAYGGPVEMIEGFVSRGAYFSFNASFLAGLALRKREAFLHMPPDRLLVETDAPAMPPPPEWTLHRLPESPGDGALNHPANLPAAYEGLAALLGREPAGLAALVGRNFNRLFRPPAVPATSEPSPPPRQSQTPR